jgi:prophage DNA circulation protein
MSWRESLRSASFRGASFHVRSHDATLGRRTVQHEYPLRDTPYTEDMGRLARGWRVEAYVLGPDYMAARDALLAALEEPGPGTLVHPWLGSLRVCVARATLRETTDKGGMATVSVEFLEAGEDSAPSRSVDTGALVGEAADAATGTLAEDFAAHYDTQGYPEHVREDGAWSLGAVSDALSQALGVVRAPSGTLAAIQGQTVSLAAQALTLAGAPGAMASGVLGTLAALSGSGSGVLAAYRTMWDFGLSRSWGATGTAARGSASLSTAALVVPAGAEATTATRTLANRAAVAALVRRAAVVEASRAAASQDYASANDALATREELGERLDLEMDSAGDATFRALGAVRTALVLDLTERGARLPALRSYRPGATLPALVVAHNVWGDATRADEVVSRNRAVVRHPGFVPGGVDLEVLDA